MGRQKWGRGLGREARRAEWPILGGAFRARPIWERVGLGQVGLGAWRDGERNVPTCSKIWKGWGEVGVGERELGE